MIDTAYLLQTESSFSVVHLPGATGFSVDKVGDPQVCLGRLATGKASVELQQM